MSFLYFIYEKIGFCKECEISYLGFQTFAMVRYFDIGFWDKQSCLDFAPPLALCICILVQRFVDDVP